MRDVREQSKTVPRIDLCKRPAHWRPIVRACTIFLSLFFACSSGIASETDLERSVTARTTALRFTPDGLMLFSGHEDGSVHVWDAISLKPVSGKSFEKGESAVRCLAVSEGTRFVAASFVDGKVMIWDPEQNQKVDALDLGPGGGLRIAFSPATCHLLCTRVGSVILRDVEHRKNLLEADLSTAYVSDVSFSPDGGRVAIGTENYEVLIIDGHSLALLRRMSFPKTVNYDPEVFREDTDVVSAVCWLPDGKTVVSGEAAGVISFLDAASGKVMDTVEIAQSNNIKAIRVSNDGRTMAFLAISYGVGVIHLQGRKQKRNLWPFVWAFALSPDGQKIVVGGKEKALHLLHLPSAAAEAPQKEENGGR